MPFTIRGWSKYLSTKLASAIWLWSTSAHCFITCTTQSFPSQRFLLFHFLLRRRQCLLFWTWSTCYISWYSCRTRFLWSGFLSWWTAIFSEFESVGTSRLLVNWYTITPCKCLVAPRAFICLNFGMCDHVSFTSSDTAKYLSTYLASAI